jgi:hypothetical protein
VSLLIDANTKISDLLAAYPAAAEHLPALKAIENPVLRKTVEQSSTIERLARLGGVDAQQLVKLLREAAGQAAAAPARRVRFEINATAMLEQGVHPIGQVRECGAQLQPGESILLESPFRPDPLIETMRRSGFEVECEEISPGRYHTCITRGGR